MIYMNLKGGNSLSQLTKKAIVEATLRLAQSRPISKITVRDIVEECGITRNTFYYHFHDIYEVLEDVIDSKFDALEGSWGTDYDSSTKELLDFCAEHKKILFNLYRAIGHEALAGYLRRRIHAILMERLHAENAPYGASEADLALICSFYEEALTGLLLRWLKEEDFSVFDGTGRLGVLFDGTIRVCIENLARKTSGNL